MARKKYAHAQILPLFTDLPSHDVQEPPIRVLRSVRRMCYGDALECGVLRVVYDVTDSGDAHYACYVGKRLHMAVDGNDLAMAQRRVALWLQRSGYDPREAQVIEGYAYLHDVVELTTNVVAVQLSLLGVA